MISDKERGSCGHDKNETGKIATKKNFVRVSMNQQYRISEHEILYYDNSKVQLFVIICLLCNTTHGNTKG
jgi:hypothetical protein